MNRCIPFTTPFLIIPSIILSSLFVSCSPAPIDYVNRPEVVVERSDLYTDLLSLLHPNDRKLKAAQQEARWLADNSFKAGAGLSRVYDSSFPGWSGNYLVNMHIQQRGLCWHYQHDLFGELRRRPLTFFRIGTTTRDKGTGSAHSCVYIAAKGGVWPNAMVIDPWMWNGRTKVSKGWKLPQDDWEDTPELTQNTLNRVYPEGHQTPMEFWYFIKNKDGIYVNYDAPSMLMTEQYRYMFESIETKKDERHGKPTNY